MMRSLISCLCIGLALLLGGASAVPAAAAQISPSASPYSVEALPAANPPQYRFWYNNQHFLSLIYQDGSSRSAAQTFILRPHPGLDTDGWGSSLYLQPFLPGAVLDHTTTGVPSASDTGIQVNSSGYVSRGPSGTYGTWSHTLTFQYDPLLKKVSGSGEYTITLEGVLSNAPGDLNLYRIASSYLDDVPLLGGATGDTGDMRQANVNLGSLAFTWVPPLQPGHFPAESADALSIDVVGAFNTVDTQAMGQAPIEAAFKPDLKVALSSRQPGTALHFGGLYDLSKRQDPYADNVGITPWIASSSQQTAFTFDLVIESTVVENFTHIPLVSR